MDADAWIHGCGVLRRAAQRLLGDPGTDGLSDDQVHRLARELELLRARVIDSVPGVPYLQQPVTRAAYHAGLAPRTLAAVMREVGNLPPTTRVLDVGCGTGAAALGTVLSGATSVDLVDHDGSALEEAERVIRDAAPGVQVATRRGVGVPDDVPTGTHDLVVAAFSLVEMSGEDPVRAARVLSSLVARVKPGTGRLLIVDSAQRERARLLQGLRDAVVAAGMHLHAPCPHHGACPALERPRDFCHAAARWNLPADLVRVGERAGVHRERLTYAFLLAGRTPRPVAGLVRVIGDVQREKGRARVAVCSDGALRELVALSRHRAVHAALEALPRGALLGALPTGDRSLRVEDVALLREPP